MFDSGVGGLTVARAVIDLLPHEPLIYVGDTARFPYGPKPVEDIKRYALEVADYLIHRDVKMLVVACNSVEVSAIDDIAHRAGIPVVGVIDPGNPRRGAGHPERHHRVDRHTGHRDERRLRPGGPRDGRRRDLRSQACPAFVEHVERGDTTSPELRIAARGYLSPLMADGIDTLILGCTHYPLLSGLLQRELGPGVVLVSSAEETAKDVYAALLDHDLQARREPTVASTSSWRPATRPDSGVSRACSWARS